MTASMREAQAQDWLEDLREFGPEVVSAACVEWRRQPGGKRPTPGDIRAIALEIRASSQLRIARRPDLTDAEANAAADEWARGHGFESVEDYRRSNPARGLSVQVGPGRFKRFPPIFDEHAA